MKIKEGGGMDIQEKKAFEIAFDNKLGARGCQFDLDEDGNYEDRETLCGWHMWLEAKAQTVPEGYVLVEKKLIKTLHEELLDHEPDSFVVNRDICELWKQAEAREPAND